MSQPQSSTESSQATETVFSLGAINIEEIREEFHTPLSCSYVWDYSSANKKLERLYELGKKLNWNASIDIDWSLNLDRSKSPIAKDSNPFIGFAPYEAMTRDEQINFDWHRHCWAMSQFLHGEQGALMVASQLVSCAPTHDAKLYSASQAFDEARHVEVFSNYINQKLGLMYPVNAHLKSLLDSILVDERWDLKFIGMQVIIEGLALAAFHTIKNMTSSPLLASIVQGVIQDEARHVAFGMIFLEEFIKALPLSEREDRAMFAYQACVNMRDRLFEEEVFEQFGWDVEDAKKRVHGGPAMHEFRNQMFSRIIPNLSRIGLLTDSVRPLYEKIGILDYEHYDDAAHVDWKKLEQSIFQES